MLQLNIMKLTGLQCTNYTQLTAGGDEEETGKYMNVERVRASDYALAQASAEGDRAAFKELYQRHNCLVYSLCLRLTGNTAEAEDLTQETFIQLFHKIGSFRGESAFSMWLHRLTINQVLMQFRKRGVQIERTMDNGQALAYSFVVGESKPGAGSGSHRP